VACLGGTHLDEDRVRNELARSAEVEEEVEAQSAEHPICAQKGDPFGIPLLPPMG